MSCRYLGCYLSVWHCYLGSILAFSFEIIKLNTTTFTKSSTQLIKINLNNRNSLFPTLIVNNSGCMYLFTWINSDWLIDGCLLLQITDQNELHGNSSFNDPIPQIEVWLISFSVDHAICYCRECVRYLPVRNKGHTGVHL